LAQGLLCLILLGGHCSNCPCCSMSFSSPFRADVLVNRVALITGGGSGMGKEIATTFAKHGAKVCIFGRREAFLAAAVAEIEGMGVTQGSVIFCRGDVRVEGDCQRAVDVCLRAFGYLNVLVNSAAGNFQASTETLTPKGFRTVVDIDTFGTYNMCHASFDALKRAVAEGRDTSSCIINITVNSKWSEGRAWYQAHVASAKAAINTLGNALALEWGEHGIRVNEIGPGFIADTPGMAMSPPEVQQAMGRMVPLKRLGQKSEIAMAAVFLCVNEYVSGHNLVVDGAEWIYPGARPMSLEQLKAGAKAAESRKRSMGAPASKL